jgi:3-oxoacyl-[acyl-carrier protein] reductase
MMSRPDLLAGRVALVTGASRGIGAAIAKALVEAGATVWLAARTEGSLDATLATLNGLGAGEARALYFDVADPAAIKQAFGTIQKADRRLDVLVNNAGILKASMIEMASVEMMDETYQVNLRSVLVASQYAARLMARNGGGSIINLTSIMGAQGFAGQAVYAASKAGVIGVTKSLAKEFAARQIRVNAIAPGAIDTALIEGLSEEKRQETVASIGMGRLGTPEDVAALGVFLSSDAASYITGQVIGVDGGMVV